MREIAFCKLSGRLYQGRSSFGTPVENPTPMLPIEFVGVDMQVPDRELWGYSGLIFREDSFDPITKIRRGRVYRQYSSQPATWHVQDPIRKDLNTRPWGGGLAQLLEAISYQIDSLTSLRSCSALPKVVLGDEPYHSFWKVLSIESQVDGQPLITLKALHSFGVIPELLAHHIQPTTALRSIQQTLDKVEASANRLGPVDTIDRCRDALSVVFGALAGDLHLDLGKGVGKYVESNKARNPKGNGENLVSRCADTVRRLHYRGKPNEQERHQTRPLTDDDANLALSCLWFVLVELGWAKA
ncbi:hypothetical protein [Ferrimonas sp. YFM]|uniref:hypothetical protein n=1 Tax=Ferrimonas sp. YFM TaxID=3028878 RepID=UPI002573725F|nr:hypothetical protein [Ferrimonas sp. YFM]BDY05971.1 hypothetical protein F0521_30120 [Ferrimonas sp. YFM]